MHILIDYSFIFDEINILKVGVGGHLKQNLQLKADILSFISWSRSSR